MIYGANVLVGTGVVTDARIMLWICDGRTRELSVNVVRGPSFPDRENERDYTFPSRSSARVEVGDEVLLWWTGDMYVYTVEGRR